jgi:hypothetical protein
MTKRNGRGIAVLLAGICAGGIAPVAAGDPPSLPNRLSGLLNDYTPASVNGGPYEMRGEWSLALRHDRDSETADFSAAMNMETSDWGISKGLVDPNDPSTRGAHTHHITLRKAAVTFDTSVCPTFNPATSGGFVVTGTANVTGNGSPAPFQSGGRPPSTVQVCITGGSTVELSNFTLTFIGLATGHFGTQAIHGVVTCTSPDRGGKELLCDDGGRAGWAWGSLDGGGPHAH